MMQAMISRCFVSQPLRRKVSIETTNRTILRLHTNINGPICVALQPLSSSSSRRDLIQRGATRPSDVGCPFPWKASHNNALPGNGFSTTSSKSHGNGPARPVSEAQRRVAQLELERMNVSTSRLLGMKIASREQGADNDANAPSASYHGNTMINEALINEARVAMHYWSRRWYMHFHPGFGRAAKGSALSLDALRNSTFGSENSDCSSGSVADVEEMEGAKETFSNLVSNVGGDHGSRQAERLLDWAISNSLVPHGLFDNFPENYRMEKERIETIRGGSLKISPNWACVNIIETYLIPFAYGGIGGDSRDILGGEDKQTNLAMGNLDKDFATLTKHFANDPSTVRSLVDATRVMKKMKSLQNQFPESLSPDQLSVKAELNIWSKRAFLLGRNQSDQRDRTLLEHNTERTVDDQSIQHLLKTLELEDARQNGEEMFGEEAYTVRGCLRRMEAILSNAEQRYSETKEEGIRPSVDWYNHVLGTWARSNLEGSLDESKRLLRGMEAFADRQNSTDFDENAAHENKRRCWAGPDTISYNSLLFCLTRHPGKSRAKEAEKLLLDMKERYHRTLDPNIQPDDVTYGTVLHALAQEGMAGEAERILDSLEQDYETFLRRTTNDNDTNERAVVIPNTTIYNSVLNAWANSNEQYAPRRAESIFRRMQNLSSTGKNPAVEPDTVSISTVILSHARSHTLEGAERGEQLVWLALDLYSKGNKKMKPDSVLFTTAMTGWANCNNPDYLRSKNSLVVPAERAELLLQKMKEMQKDNFHSVKPVSQSFNVLLDCWAKSESKGAARKAIKILREMPDFNITPDEYSYNPVLDAIAKEGDLSLVNSAEELFNEMKHRQSLGQLKMTAISYHTMMNVYGKSSDSEGARKAEALLRTMEQEGLTPSNYSYNICINAYARRGSDADNVRKAESLLEEMMVLSEKDGGENCRPTLHSFASVANAWAKSGDPEADVRAEEIVRKVEELEYVSPNTILLNTLIDCIIITGRKGSTSRAEEVLNLMKKMRQSGNVDAGPDSRTYSKVLTCLSRSKEPGAADRAEKILMDLERLYAEGDASYMVDSRSYNAVITAWARSGSPDAVERSLALLDRIERSNNPHAIANCHCYNSCMHAVAKSSHPRKARLCEEILERMIATTNAGLRDAAPNLITYSTIINACAYTNGTAEENKEAFNIAKSCLRTILESNEMQPSQSCFTNMFRVICTHLKQGETRDRFAEALYHEACKQEEMGEQTLKNFRRASPAMAAKLLSG